MVGELIGWPHFITFPVLLCNIPGPSLVSFPGLPFFVLGFVLTVIRGKILLLYGVIFKYNVNLLVYPKLEKGGA